MRRPSLAPLLFMLLALQLAIGLQPVVGLQLDAAYGAAHQPAAAAPSSAAVHSGCPTHAKHDCCKSSGCESHCGILLLAFNFVPPFVTPTTDRVLSLSAARIPSEPVEPHFRPPITV